MPASAPLDVVEGIGVAVVLDEGFFVAGHPLEHPSSSKVRHTVTSSRRSPALPRVKLKRFWRSGSTACWISRSPRIFKVICGSARSSTAQARQSRR